MLRLFKSQLESDVQAYCATNNVHPENAKIMLKVARSLPRHTPCTAQDIATKLCIGVVIDSGAHDSIYGSRNGAR